MRTVWFVCYSCAKDFNFHYEVKIEDSFFYNKLHGKVVQVQRVNGCPYSFMVEESKLGKKPRT